MPNHQPKDIRIHDISQDRTDAYENEEDEVEKEEYASCDLEVAAVLSIREVIQ